MNRTDMTRGLLSLVLATALALAGLPAGTARADEGAQGQPVVAAASAVPPSAQPEFQPAAQPLAPAKTAHPAEAADLTASSAAKAPTADLASPAPSGAPLAAPTPAPTAPTAASVPQESQPEGAEKPPELVGPDDDRLLEEVEKRVNIAPAEPAIQLAEPAYDLPLELNTKVLDYVEIFQTTRRRNFEVGLVRSKKYESLMKPIFKELGIPTDLYYLALIESAYNPKAYSYARAAGIWQFISSTGRLYGLRRTEYLDERCDPAKSARAAAQHLKDLYAEFGSWPLVLAAYNAGKGRVQRDIAKAGTTDFWSLPLPAQTRNYVPAFYAALIIAKEPERYGFQLDYEELPETDVVEVGGGTRLSLVAALCGTSVDAIRELNPELRRSACPPGGKYSLRIPGGSTARLAAGLAKVPAGKTTAGWSAYRVAPGDTLFSIAQRFGTTAEAVREANRLKDNAIRIGDQLTVPGQRTAAAAIPRAPGRVEISSAIPTTYRVQGGDSPWAIARRFNISLADLLAWNGLDEESVLSIGRPLLLREPATADSRDASRTARAATYVVRKGDNLWEIGRKFETSVDELRRVNGFGPEHRLRVGDRVILPNL